MIQGSENGSVAKPEDNFYLPKPHSDLFCQDLNIARPLQTLSQGLVALAALLAAWVFSALT